MEGKAGFGRAALGKVGRAVTRLTLATALLAGILLAGTALAEPQDVRVHWEPVQLRAYRSTGFSGTTVYWTLRDDAGNPVAEVNAFPMVGGKPTVVRASDWNKEHSTTDGLEPDDRRAVDGAFVVQVYIGSAKYWAYSGNHRFAAPVDDAGDPVYPDATRTDADGTMWLDGVWVAPNGSGGYEPTTLETPPVSSPSYDPSNGYLAAKGLWRGDATAAAPIAGDMANMPDGTFFDLDNIKSTDTILDHEPTVNVTDPKSWFTGIAFFLFDGCHRLSSTVLSLGTACISLIDPKSLFTADFGSAQWADFRAIAQNVSEKVALPYGTAILLIAFIMNLSRLGEERTATGADAILRTVLMFLVAWTILAHSLEVFAGIYWLCKNLAVGVDLAIGETIGYADTTILISQGFDKAMGQVQYQDWLLGILFVVLAALVAVCCFTCSLKIMTFAFLRMVEIYLRAAFAGIPLAFVSFKEGRAVALNYAKRFAAVALQGAVMLAALVLGMYLMRMSASFFNVAADGPIQQVLVSVFPALITLGSLSAIVDRVPAVSGDIVNVFPAF